MYHGTHVLSMYPRVQVLEFLILALSTRLIESTVFIAIIIRAALLCGWECRMARGTRVRNWLCTFCVFIRVVVTKL